MQSLEFLDKRPEENGVPGNVLKVAFHKGLTAPPTEEEFVRIIKADGLESAIKIYRGFKAREPQQPIINESLLIRMGYDFYDQLAPGSASYASAIVVQGGGRKQYVQFLSRGLVGVDAKTGEFLWRYKEVVKGPAQVFTPVARDGYVYAGALSVAYADGLYMFTPGKEMSGWWRQPLKAIAKRADSLRRLSRSLNRRGRIRTRRMRIR